MQIRGAPVKLTPSDRSYWSVWSCIPSLFEALRALQVPAAAEDGHSQGQSGYCHHDVQDLHHATGTVPDIKSAAKKHNRSTSVQVQNYLRLIYTTDTVF